VGLKEDIEKHRKAIYDAKNPKEIVDVKESKLALLLKERRAEDETNEKTKEKNEPDKELAKEPEIKEESKELSEGEHPVPLTLTEAEFKLMQEIITERQNPDTTKDVIEKAIEPKTEPIEKKVETTKEPENAKIEPAIVLAKEPEKQVDLKLTTEPIGFTKETVDSTGAIDPSVLEQNLQKGRDKLEIRTRPHMSNFPIATVIQKECENKKVPEANRDLVASAAIVNNEDVTSENVGEIVQGVLEKHPNLMRATSYPAIAGSTSPNLEQDYSKLTLKQRRQVFVKERQAII